MSCQALLQRLPPVPRMASQPRGLRLAAARQQGLDQHDEDAGEGEDVLRGGCEEVAWLTWRLTPSVRLAGLRVRGARPGSLPAYCCDEGTPRVDGANPEGRGDAHEQEENDQWPQGEVFAGGEIVRAGAMNQRRLGTVEDALDHPEHVGGAEDDACGGEDRPADVLRGETRLERVRNSPTKPLSMGRPTRESVVRTNIVTIHGSFGGEAAVLARCRRCRSARRGRRGARRARRR